MSDNGLIKINGNRAKASSNVSENDIISIGGQKSITLEVKQIPQGNIKKDDRPEYYNLME